MASAVCCLGRAIPETACAQRCRGEGRRGEMTALDWVLPLAIIILAVLVLAGLIIGARTLRNLQGVKAPDPGFLADKDRHEQSLAALRSAADEASTAVDDAKAKAASVRAEAAAAKAEAT